jgi:GntR family transcriptional regulator
MGMKIEMKLDRKAGTPYYVQLKNILKNRIQNGDLKDGRIPPIRQLAQEFGVSINTALRAYEGLRREGLAAGTVGRGTFVITTPEEQQRHNRQILLRRVIEHTLEEALTLEYTIEEFYEAVGDLVQEKRELMQNLRLAFIECNIEQLLYFTDHLELDPRIHRIPVLLDDVKGGDAKTLEALAASDIIVTSFYHVNEVRERLSHLGAPIVGISLEPEINTIIRIAKIPEESTVGIVTTSEDFRSIIRQILTSLGLRFARILETTSRDDEAVREVVSQCDALLVSPQRRQQVTEMARTGVEVIEFVFTPDRTSVNNLKVALIELQNGRK